LPSVNIKESKELFEIELAAPGLKKEDFRMELNNDLLSISCQKPTENELKESESYTKKEFSYSSFCRTFNPSWVF